LVCMSLSLKLHTEIRDPSEDSNSLNVAITPSTTLSLESMSSLVMPPVADFLGDLGTTEKIVLNVDSNPSTLRLLADQYLEGQKRIEEATIFVDKSINARASQDYEQSLQVMLQTNFSSSNEDFTTLLALGA
jgi:hypothetical protein